MNATDMQNSVLFFLNIGIKFGNITYTAFSFIIEYPKEFKIIHL